MNNGWVGGEISALRVVALLFFAGDETRLYLEGGFLHERQKQRFATPYSKGHLQSSAHCHHSNSIMLWEGPVLLATNLAASKLGVAVARCLI
jgi:hypothetical protein